MSEEIEMVEDVGPATLAPTARQIERKSSRLKADSMAGERGFVQKLKAMKQQSGLSTRAIAKRMGIQRESLNQYFWMRRGKGGSGRLSWFLRYAEATGCSVWLTYPSLHEQEKLKAAMFVPSGNPNWRKVVTKPPE